MSESPQTTGTSTAAELATPLLETHRALGGKLVPFAGYQMPIQYSGIVKEHQAVRGAVGLFDVSHMGELRLKGHGALAFVNHLVTNDLERISLGQAMYTCCCKEDGGILDDLIVYKHADDDILVVCNASNRAKIAAHFHAHAAEAPDVKFSDESDATALLALQGPRAFDVLANLDPGLDMLSSELRPFRFLQHSHDGLDLTIARTGYTGEDGVEIFCPSEQAVSLWNKLTEAGSKEGLLPAGLGCRDTLRLEARLSLYGNELDEETSPLEAGLAWTVKLSKASFVGQKALAQTAQDGVKKTLVGFEMRGRGIGRAGYKVLSSTGDELGVCTSGSPSPTLGKPIGLAYVPPEASAVGTELLIDCRGKSIPAVVVSTPFYRRPR